MSDFRLKIFFIILLVINITANAQYRSLRFEHFTPNEGLSRASVTCIIQDNKGFIWAGTFNGLNRFDGYDFHVYHYAQNDSSSLSHNYISSVIQDYRGDLWVGTSDGLNKYVSSRDNFVRFRHDRNNPFSISDNQIESIFEDSNKRLWVGTRNGGLNLYDEKTNRFKHYFYDANNPDGISSNFVREIFEDSKGRLWIGHWNGSIDIKNAGDSVFKPLFYKGNKLTNTPVTAISQSSDGAVWIGTQGDGLLKLSFRGDDSFTVKRYLHNPADQNSISGNVIFSLMIDRNGFVWIGTEDEGLSIYDPVNDAFITYKANPIDPFSLNNNSIYSIFEDRDGNVWLGTYAGGINLVVKGKAYFHHYKNIPGDKYSLGHNIVNYFWEDDKGNLWIATGGNGIDIFDRKTNRFSHKKLRKNDGSIDVVLSFYEDSNGDLWIGTWGNGLFKFDTKSERFTHYTKESNGLASDNIFKMVEDEKKRLWLCTFWGGLTRMDIETGKVKIYNTENSGISDNDLRAIIKDHTGKLWIGTDIGLELFDPESETFKLFKHNNDDPKSITKGFVTFILEARDSSLWIGTTSGLNKYEPETGGFKHYTTNDGLPGDEVMAIVEDKNNILWISTTKGITRFNPSDGSVKNYDVSDGLQSGEFTARSGYMTSKGEILFGGNNGFNLFEPDKLVDNKSIPPVYITDLKIFNKPVAVGKEDSPLKENIVNTKELILSYKHSVISFGFVALNYNSPEKNQYAYMLEGFDKDWNYVGNVRTATYTNLDPGEYRLKVKASNNDGIWNEAGAVLNIIIEPPFYKTWWAYLIEFILISVIVYFISNYYISRKRLRNALKKEHIELEKMYELDHLKNQFFTNVSHELQSPLTLVLSPLEKIISSDEVGDKIKNNLMVIYRNAKRLQRMANQLKDLNKLDTGDLKLYLSRGDIINFIRESAYSFHDIAVDHKIDFHFSSGVDNYTAWFDADKFDKVIYNLLSNAFKFTPDGGRITVSVNIINADAFKGNGSDDKADNYIEIIVEDTGIGIPENKIEHIFERYYHIEDYKGKRYDGMGIGLALVSELVKLYKGCIFVESKEGEGAKFTVQIPLDEHYLEENQLVAKFKISSSSQFLAEPGNSKNNETSLSKYKLHNVPVLLIVEDDDEIREYIKNSFQYAYRVHEAEDGETGYKKALQIIPDIIISDVKMKKLDGITLCNKLKNDKKTSHIPVIILTSYNTQEYHIKSINQGADAYLPKPFNISVLEAYITNLLESRKKMQEKFSKEFIYGDSKIPLTDIDAQFLESLVKIIEEHISDEKFNADVLSKEIGMSRMQLYRKLRGLTDQTVHEFIRNIRLKKATQMLEQKKMTITEIAFAVGFNDLTYFARCFKKQYGKSPSEYMSNKNN
ncbi:two-component regulator propeller domain-containing protein [Melioribacter sp. Ez-97]|uniref:two-component regulator propeller domain-containing protein n=1 Tax=Melioribacter sp. Ez-97 TaxID=3423434 RepID=UPI003EDAF6C4